MSTHSFICMEVGDSIQAIYSHFDGYIDGVGATLKEHYQAREKIEKLISLGDISSLCDTPEDCHVYEDSEVRRFDSIMELLEAATDSYVEYVYLYTDTGQWLWYEVFDDNSKWRNL
ncbi:MAG: hypothetical protein PHQ75_06300 [Thermoguttaceae bacterium]|nr:hypothetical protein [Thermoguttaceae bacterium]